MKRTCGHCERMVDIGHNFCSFCGSHIRRSDKGISIEDEQFNLLDEQMDLRLRLSKIEFYKNIICAFKVPQMGI